MAVNEIDERLVRQTIELAHIADVLGWHSIDRLCSAVRSTRCACRP